MSWFIENKPYQISERFGLALIVLSLPLFYFDLKWQIGVGVTTEKAGATTLAHLIIFLSVIKLSQRKANRDWIFLYLISFFEVLLAAGLTISPIFFAALIFYLFFAVCAIISFEIIKSKKESEQERVADKKNNPKSSKRLALRLQFTAFSLLVAVILLAIPVFFIMPRTNSASFVRSSGGLKNFIGFSDSVSLGDIGRVQQNNEIVMRVKIDRAESGSFQPLRWRGVALDEFSNTKWRKSLLNREVLNANETGRFVFGKAENEKNITTQLVYLEPIDTPTLFFAPRLLALQANFPFLNRDGEKSVQFPRNELGRVTYKVYSDTSAPDYEALRRDETPYPIGTNRYLQVPSKFDSRISELAAKIISDAGAKNRYEKALVIERYLQNNYGYTLDLKAQGEQPLADFLFNVREGHCEYFATAMAMMLRSQGMATRIVNGFQEGEFNETASVYVVRQKDAHSWVEVYFPKDDVWIAFDPTPAASSNESESYTAGIFKTLGKYTEALETFWIQYVVSYDTQEQRSLARNLRSGFEKYQQETSSRFEDWQKRFTEWLQSLRGQKGVEEQFAAMLRGSLWIAALVIGGLISFFLIRFLRRLNFFKRFGFNAINKQNNTVIAFYERMTKVLAKQGKKRVPSQTPLEFAFALQMPEAVKITEAYNKVRFGEKNLEEKETAEIENWLNKLEKKETKV